MFEDFRHAHVVVFDPTTIVVWILSVAGLALLDVAEIVATV